MALIVQVAGSITILTAFVLTQLGVLDGRSRSYLVLNLVGSSVLAVDAYLHAQWGFFLLEAVWAAVSGLGLVQVLRGQPARAA
jgi:hypothetical protein